MGRSNEIDFVISWVDDKDANWQNKRAQYMGVTNAQGNEAARYRNWDTLKYWFRGVEKFAPWVRNIYFVTDDQKPQWLNTHHPKLKWIKHTDYMPKEYLPTFNSSVIELNLHRIEGLSENFIYFNDDVFLIKDTKAEDFFVNNLQCDLPVFEPVIPQGFFSYIPFNNSQLINRHFSPNTTIKKHFKKFFKAQTFAGVFKNLLYGRKPFFYGMGDYHIHIPFKKSSFFELWEKEYVLLDKVCKNKFRTKEDVSAWAVRYYTLMKGEFYPKKPIGQLFHTQTLDDSNEAIEYIRKQKGKVVCINDTQDDNNFEAHKKMVVDAFEQILKEKSAFEL